MQHQQNKIHSERAAHQEGAAAPRLDPSSGHPFYRGARLVSVGLFHENYAIFVLPVLLLLNLVLLRLGVPDLRITLTILGGTAYFVFVALEIVMISSAARLDKAYQRLFFSDEKPDLPGEMFFR